MYDTRKVIRNLIYDYGRGDLISFFCGILLNIWSIKQAVEMRTITCGQRDFGKNLFVNIISKNSLNVSRSLICNRFTLKSPTTVAHLFSICNKSTIGEGSTINFEIFSLSLLSWGGLYILPIVNGRLRLGSETSINTPSQTPECLYRVLLSYVKSSFEYIKSPPCFKQMKPWWINLYPGICSNDRSLLTVSKVSCRQIAPTNSPKEDNLLMIAKK